MFKYRVTYLEAGKSKVANLDLLIVIDQDVVGLDVSVDDAERVHVLEDSG